MTVQVGEQAPNFTLIDQHGAQRVLWDELEDHIGVVVFYPFAFSGVCRGELELLQENLDKFRVAGAQVLAISVDSMHAQRMFAETHGFEFPLLADFWPHGDVAERYGAFNSVAGVAQRATFIIDSTCKVRALVRSDPHEPRDIDEYFSAVYAIASTS